MFQVLKKPYPFPAPSLKSFLVNTSVSVFVGLFLTLFQPFGLSELNVENKNLILWGYALTCFAATNFVTFVLLFLLRRTNNEESWNLLKEICFLFLLILFIALANVTYSSIIGFGHFAIGNFLYAILYTGLIGIFPISLSVSINYNRLKNRSETEASAINSILKEIHTAAEVSETKTENNTAKTQEQQEHLLVLSGENNSDTLKIHAAQLLYIQSADNYSEIYYTENGRLKKQLLRGSLRLMESQINEETGILRCHRACIVNLNNVEKASGNAQGYKLSLPYTDFLVPVSRAYVQKVSELFKNLK